MELHVFDQVLKDNVSGSGAVVEQVQDDLLGLARTTDPVYLQSVNRELLNLRKHFPQFGVLFHFLKSFNEAYTGRSKATGPELERFVLNYRQQCGNMQQTAIQRFCDEVGLSGKTVLLHSNSSTLHQLFENDFTQKPTIYQTLSSPANEGLVQASILSKRGYQVKLFHEDALSKYISNIDLAILGADLILDDVFLNKIGSFPISLLCNHFSKPVYVLADRRKKINLTDISAEDLQLFRHEQPKPANEITVENIESIQVLNEYFEFIPLNLIAKMFL